MRAPVVIYYLLLLAFAWVLAFFFINLGNALTRQYRLTEDAVRQDREVLSRNRVVR